jgi:hypothetical protein
MQEFRMKERNVTLDGFWELPTDCVLIYEWAVVAILLHEFVLSDQAVEYFAMMAHMWESTDVSPGFVPPKPGWPCLDTDFATTIMSLPRELLNLGHIVLIFLAFSLERTFRFSIFFQVFPQPAEQGIPSCAHGGRLRGLHQCLGRQVCRHQLTPPLGILGSIARRCLSRRAP